MSALDQQIGGKHYKSMPYQPVKLITELNLNFIQGNIVKYVSRYKFKNGKQDLEKILHYAQLGQELDPLNVAPFDYAMSAIKIYLFTNKLDETVGKVIEAAIYQDWLTVMANVIKLIKGYE